MNKTYCDLCGTEIFSWNDSNGKHIAWKLQTTGSLEGFTIDMCKECYDKVMKETKYDVFVHTLKKIIGIKER